MADIFLSHAAADRAVAETICSALESRRHSCWIAVRDVRPGANYMNEIVEAIRDCKVMVLIFSKSANGSDEITKELALASKYKKYVVPARVENELPTAAFEYALADRQWIDLFRDWDRRLTDLSDLIAEKAPPSQLEARPNEGKSEQEGKIKRLYASLRDDFLRGNFDIPLMLGCIDLDPDPNATLTLTRVTQGFWAEVDFAKRRDGIHVRRDHSDMGGWERLYYFKDGDWKFTTIITFS